MSVPYRYIRGAAVNKDDHCALCSARSTSLVVDHCHTHGYARGILCARCNCPECRRTASVDSPDAYALRVVAIVAAVAEQLSLTPRQAASLAHSYLDETETQRNETSTETQRASAGAKRSVPSQRNPRSFGAVDRSAAKRSVPSQRNPEASAQSSEAQRNEASTATQRVSAPAVSDDSKSVAVLARELLKAGSDRSGAAKLILAARPSVNPQSVRAEVRRQANKLVQAHTEGYV